MNCWIGLTPPSHDRWLHTLPLMCWKPPMDAACCLNPARSDGGALLEWFIFQWVCAFFHYLYHKCDRMRERIKKYCFHSPLHHLFLLENFAISYIFMHTAPYMLYYLFTRAEYSHRVYWRTVYGKSRKNTLLEKNLCWRLPLPSEKPARG